jgi:2-furoyl-CoA dehydrogenase FAD binding subunit
VKANEFFTGLMSTARRDDELIEAVSFPCRRAGEGFAFREFARRHGDFAIVACAAVATETSVRLAVGGVTDRAVVRDFDDVSEDSLRDFASELDARDDLHATADYRRMLVRKLGAQTIAEAQQCRG